MEIKQEDNTLFDRLEKRTVIICLILLLLFVLIMGYRIHSPSMEQYDMPPMVYVYGESYITYSQTPWPTQQEMEEIIKKSVLIGQIVEFKGKSDDAYILSSDEPVGSAVYVNEHYPQLIFVKSNKRINLYERIKVEELVGCGG